MIRFALQSLTNESQHVEWVYRWWRRAIFAGCFGKIWQKGGQQHRPGGLQQRLLENTLQLVNCPASRAVASVPRRRSLKSLTAPSSEVILTTLRRRAKGKDEYARQQRQFRAR